MQPPVATDLSELLKQYGEACTQIALRCAVAVFDRSSKPDPLIEKVEQDKAGIASRITSLFASATEAGARIERDKILPLLKRIERAAQGLGGYIGQDGQLLKEVQKVIRESDTCETSNK
jgi:hypothetical protein